VAVEVVIQVLRAVGRHFFPISGRHGCTNFLNDLPDRPSAGVKGNFANWPDLQIGAHQ
jgi:hypothetical protein